MANPDVRVYDTAEHRNARAAAKPTVDAGQAYCAEIVCLMRSRWIKPGTPWDMAHDRLHGGYHGPAHAKCNRAEGGRYGRRKARIALIRSRNW